MWNRDLLKQFNKCTCVYRDRLKLIMDWGNKDTSASVECDNSIKRCNHWQLTRDKYQSLEFHHRYPCIASEAYFACDCIPTADIQLWHLLRLYKRWRVLRMHSKSLDTAVILTFQRIEMPLWFLGFLLATMTYNLYTVQHNRYACMLEHKKYRNRNNTWTWQNLAVIQSESRETPRHRHLKLRVWTKYITW